MSKSKYVPYYFLKAPDPPEVLPANTTLGGAIHRMLFRLNGYNKYGLFHDDILYNYPDVLEAIRRLPGDIQDERNFRLVRAVQFSLNHLCLPPEKWTKYEDDLTIGRYLTPYLEEVRREIKERDAWEAAH